MTEVCASGDLQLVTFLLDGEEYALDVMQVREIICVPEITPSPAASPEVEGMINLRGSIIPVISLRKKLGLPQIDHDIDTRIAVMNTGGEEIGLILDRVCEVMRVKRGEVREPPTTMGQPWVAGVLNLDQLVVLMDLEKLGVV